MIYLDYAAATPLDPAVAAVMGPYFATEFFNPSAAYEPARHVARAMQAARADIARLLGGKADEIIFTAGATESINLAFRGILTPTSHVVVSAVEHPAILETARQYDYSIVPVDAKGRIKLEALEKLIQPGTQLVSIGLVNNEIGTIQPLSDVARMIKKIRQQRAQQGNAIPLLLHSDASQAGGLLSLNMTRLGVDLLTLNAAKLYGPKQMGLLWIRQSLILSPLLHGGGQERGLRSGTENVPGIVGFAAALEKAEQQRSREQARLQDLRQFFLESLSEKFDDMVVIGDPKHHAPHILTLSWPGLDAERLLFGLEARGVLVATGAACAASKATRSHVLIALGLSESVIDGSLRFSFGRQTSRQQLVRAVKIIEEVIKKERALQQ